jgi:sigma-70-like protein
MAVTIARDMARAWPIRTPGGRCPLAPSLDRLRMARWRRRRPLTYSLDDLGGGRPIDDTGPLDPRPSPEVVQKTLELHRLVDAALDALPVEQRAAVRRHYVEGLRLREIASLLGAHRVLLLRERAGDRVLPIWVGPAGVALDARAAAARAQVPPSTRPVAWSRIAPPPGAPRVPRRRP